MSTLRMYEAVREEGAGLWVGANQYGQELPNETEANFIVQKTAKGLWRVAVKGYNGGKFFPTLVNTNGEVAAQIGDQHYPAMDSHQRLISVDDETMQLYEESLRDTDDKDRGLLLNVLEGEKQGLWSLSGPAEYNIYEEFAQLLYGDASQVGLSWGEWREWDDNNPDQSGYHVKKPVAAQVVVDGPEFHVRPYDHNVSGVTASAIKDRIKYFPTATNLVRDLSDADTIALRYMNDDFAYGSPAVETQKTNVLETIYGK